MAGMLTGFVMEAGVSAKVGAAPRERSPERNTHRIDYRERHWDTRLVSCPSHAVKKYVGAK
jgi:hypothetical protein